MILHKQNKLKIKYPNKKISIYINVFVVGDIVKPIEVPFLYNT